MIYPRRALIVACVVVLAGCTGTQVSPSPSATAEEGAPSSPASSEPEPTTAELTELTVAYQAILSLSPLFVAEEKGFFADHGIVNEYARVGSGYDVIGLLSQGVIDINAAVGAGAAWFNALNSGLNVNAAGGRLRYTCSSDAALLVRTALWDEGLRTPADMQGRKVAILSRGSAIEYWTQLFLENEGLTEADLGEVVVLTYPDTVSAFASGAIDFAIVGQPLAGQAILDGTAKLVAPVHPIVPDMDIGFLAMSDSLIERGDLAAEWMAAWLEGVRYYLDPANKDEVIGIVAEWTEVDEGLLNELYGTDQWAYMPTNGTLDMDNGVLPHVQWQLDNELIESIPPPEDWYDPGPVEAAVELVGEVDEDRDCESVPQFGAGD